MHVGSQPAYRLTRMTQIQPHIFVTTFRLLNYLDTHWNRPRAVVDLLFSEPRATTKYKPWK